MTDFLPQATPNKGFTKTLLRWVGSAKMALTSGTFNVNLPLSASFRLFSRGQSVIFQIPAPHLSFCLVAVTYIRLEGAVILAHNYMQRVAFLC
jgi:hypothetical protein